MRWEHSIICISMPSLLYVAARFSAPCSRPYVVLLNEETSAAKSIPMRITNTEEADIPTAEYVGVSDTDDSVDMCTFLMDFPTMRPHLPTSTAKKHTPSI